MTVIIVCILALGILVASQFIWIKVTGSPVPPPDIPRNIQTAGSGTELRYAVLGDSTAVSQGGDYAKGYAQVTAEYLSKTRRAEVKWINVGVPGARAKDTAGKQVQEAAVFKPDIALVAVGANDVTHLTNISSARLSLKSTISQLRAVNPAVQIVLTGSPDMGSVPRLPQPTRWLAGERTKQMNKMVRELCDEQVTIFAPIAEQTGPTFRAHPELFAADKFHPTTAGYEIWIPVLTAALDKTTTMTTPVR